MTKYPKVNSMKRLVWLETKLFLREPASLVFVFAFPILTAALLGQVYGPGGSEFEGIAPADFYLVAYVGVIAAVTGLVTVPGHLASYRALGIRKRFRQSQFGPNALPIASFIVALGITTFASAALMATGSLISGWPGADAPLTAAAAFLTGTWSMIGLGTLLGELGRSSRTAQGLGLAAFFPSFLLGGGGPPPNVFGGSLRTVSDLLPLTHAIRGLQEAMLPLSGGAWNHIAISAGFGCIFWFAVIGLGRRLED